MIFWNCRLPFFSRGEHDKSMSFGKTANVISTPRQREGPWKKAGDVNFMYGIMSRGNKYRESLWCTSRICVYLSLYYFLFHLFFLLSSHLIPTAVQLPNRSLLEVLLVLPPFKPSLYTEHLYRCERISRIFSCFKYFIKFIILFII